MFQRGHQEESFDVVVQVAIHERQLELEVEIRRGAETTDDGVRAPGGSVLDGKRSVARGFYVRPLDNRRLDELDALLGAEQEPFIRAIIYRHDHVTEEIRRPPNDVHVAIVNGIEATGIQGEEGVLGLRIIVRHRSLPPYRALWPTCHGTGFVPGADGRDWSVAIRSARAR